MTALLVLICCLLLGLFITQTRENRKLKRTVLNLSARLSRLTEAPAGQATAGQAPAIQAPISQAPTYQAPASPAPASPAPARQAPAAALKAEAKPLPAPSGSGPAFASRPAPSRQPAPSLPPRPEPGPIRRWLGPGGLWPALTALLVFVLAAGFLAWFSLSLGRFSPALRLGIALLAGLTCLSSGLLTWEKRPNLGLALEGCGLGLIGLTLADAASFPGLLVLGPARAALTGLGLLAAILALKQNSPRLTLLIPPAFFGLWYALSPDWTGLALAGAGAGFFYLALALGRSALPTRLLIPSLALASFNLALAGLLFGLPLESFSPWAGLGLVWTLESLILFRLGRRRLAALGLWLAALTIPLIIGRVYGSPSSQFFLAASALGAALFYAAARPGRPETKTALVILGLGAWLAACLSTVWGLVTAYAESDFILNWLLAAGSVFGLGLWLAGRAAPELLVPRRPGSTPLLLLAQFLPLIPALLLALDCLWPLLGVNISLQPDELNPAAWAIWIPAQVLGLSQARRLTPLATAWSNAFILSLALVLSQAAAALVQNGPDFGRDMARLTVLLGALALCARPPRPAFFQDLSLCRIAGLALGGLALWQGLALTLDPADRPGFFGFLPVLNLTNLAQAAALWLPMAFLRRLTAPNRPPALDCLQAILFFLWLNVALARAVYNLTGVPYQIWPLLSSPVFLIVCAVVWGGVGLWFASRPGRSQGVALDRGSADTGTARA